MTESSAHEEDTIARGYHADAAKSSDIAESHRESNAQASTPKRPSSSKNTPTPTSSGTSAPDSTSEDRAFKPYWNRLCEELSFKLWLPHKTVSAEQPSRSFNGSFNYTEEMSSHWKKISKPNTSIRQHSLPSLLHSAPATTDDELVVASRKIRIFPASNDAYFSALSLSRRAYNLAIEWLKAQERVDLRQQTEIRRNIRDRVRQEWGEKDRPFVSVVADEAVNRAFRTFKECLKKWGAGNKAMMRFRSRKDPTQSFVVQRLSSNGPFPRVIGKIHITEDVPAEAINKMAIVTRRHGRWYLSVKKAIPVCKSDIQAQTVVALDPGVRTFMTAFSPSEAIKFGDNYASERISPLLRKRDTLLGRRKRLLNKKVPEQQWWRDQMRCVNRRLDRLSARIDDQIGDLHRRVAYDLVSTYDTIICPPFETSQMVAKEGRKLRRSSVRQMQSLGHYKFQQHLRWMCRKYGRKFVSCSEAYTSKTRSWDGVVHETLGGAKTIGDGEIVVDRDHNGARGIFLLAHTRQPSPDTDRNVTVATY